MGRVSGKMAFITGGAQGLGEATARMLAREGAKVTVTDVNGAGAEAVAASINAAHGAGTAFAYQHDVTNEARWQEVLQAAHDAEPQDKRGTHGSSGGGIRYSPTGRPDAQRIRSRSGISRP